VNTVPTVISVTRLLTEYVRIYIKRGFVHLHATRFSKPFKWLIETPWSLDYQESAERERLWTVNLGHPITNGLEESFVLPEAEMYSSPLAVPELDRMVLVS